MQLICVYVHLRTSRKCLDMLGSSSTASDTQDPDAKFTFQKVMDSFEDPRSSLFTDSMNAEMEEVPELIKMDPAKAEAYAPNSMAFSLGGRRYVKSIYTGVFKHHHACRNFCLTPRTWLSQERVLQVSSPLSGVADSMLQNGKKSWSVFCEHHQLAHGGNS